MIFKKDNKAQNSSLFDEENLDKKYTVNLNKIELISNITKDSYNHWCSDNSFIVIKCQMSQNRKVFQNLVYLNLLII